MTKSFAQLVDQQARINAEVIRRVSEMWGANMRVIEMTDIDVEVYKKLRAEVRTQIEKEDNGND